MSFFWVVLCLSLAVIALARTKKLRKDYDDLKRQVDFLTDGVVKRPAETAQEESARKNPLTSAITPKPTEAPAPAPAAAKEEEKEDKRDYHAALAREAAALRTPVDIEDAKTGGGFEFQFGQKLPVWIGGVAIALSGFYLFKYAIDEGLLTEGVRVTLGALLGFALIGAARFIRLRKPDMADGKRIAQALAGAAIAVLYATVYAATSLYHFLPASMGLVFMALVTFAAVLISLLHGMPVAVLGMVGGFLTPALIQTGSGNGPALFGYLFVIVAGLFVLIRVRAWWALAVPLMLFAFGWVLVWVFLGGHFHAGDGLFLGLFILAVCAAAFTAESRALPAAQAGGGVAEDTQPRPHGILKWVMLAGGVILMALVTAKCNFGMTEWFLYGLLGLGTIVMAWFKLGEYGKAPALAMATNLALLLAWRHPMDVEVLFTHLAFAALYTLPALVIFLRRPKLYWAALLSASALGFYGVSYLNLHWRIYDIVNVESGGAVHVWGALAFGIALGFAGLVTKVFQSFEGDEGLRDWLLALFTLMATAFLSIALLIEVHRDFLTVAFAAEMLAACWVGSKIDITALRKTAGILFGVFLLLMLPQILLLFGLAANSLFGINMGRAMPPLASEPLFQLGLPMVMAGAASWFLRLRADGRLVEALEMAVVGLGALMLYYVARHVFKVPDDVVFRKAGFFERGIITNIFFAAALLTVYCGRLYSRRALLWAGSLLFAMALFRVFWFDFFIANPFFARNQLVGASPLINSLLLPYALPLLWLWLEEKPAMRIVTPSAGAKGLLSFCLIFMLVTANVRQLFHGTDLRAGITHNAEIYTYSAAWLLLGAGLLLAGTMKKHKPLRIGSLVVMILTVAKVFLYDAGELAGLFRVFSFMGLGLSLLGLSWFYSRFVFKKEE